MTSSYICANCNLDMVLKSKQNLWKEVYEFVYVCPKCDNQIIPVKKDEITIKRKKNSDVIQVNYEDWEAIGREFYGDDKHDWKFKCAQCGHIQSINSILEHNPKLKDNEDIKRVHYNCEGRLTEGFGCNWSLYGLFHCHELELLEGDDVIMCFLFENDNANEKLKEKHVCNWIEFTMVRNSIGIPSKICNTCGKIEEER